MSEPLAEWRPALPVFIRRCVWVGAATIALFAALGLITGFWQILLAAPVLIIAYTFLFDEHLKWMAARHESWTLTPTDLIHRGYEGEALIPLSEITRTATRFGWTVIVVLKSGLKVEMAYVRNPRAIADQIIAARDGKGACA